MDFIMAYPRLSPAMPAAQQVRATTLGVNSGGSQGRMSQMHKGVGLNKNKGGLNVHGSAPKAAKSAAPMLPRPVDPRGPAYNTPPVSPFAQPNGGWRRVVRNGRPVFVAWERLTPAERQGFVRRPVRPPVASKPGVTPRPSTASPAASVPAAASDLDWGSLSSYQNAIAGIDLEAGTRRAELQRQLAESPAAFARGASEGKRSFERGLEDSEDALNRSGLLRSGAREVAEADAVREFDRYMLDLDSQFGAGAAAKVNEEIARLDEWEKQQRLGAEAAARAEFDKLYPAAPVVEQSVPAVSVKKMPSGFDAAMFKNKYLQVWDARRKRNVARAVEKMTREDILRAVARPVNKGALAAGWRVVNGRIVQG